MSIPVNLISAFVYLIFVFLIKKTNKDFVEDKTQQIIWRFNQLFKIFFVIQIVLYISSNFIQSIWLSLSLDLFESLFMILLLFEIQRLTEFKPMLFFLVIWTIYEIVDLFSIGYVVEHEGVFLPSFYITYSFFLLVGVILGTSLSLLKLLNNPKISNPTIRIIIISFILHFTPIITLFGIYFGFAIYSTFINVIIYLILTFLAIQHQISFSNKLVQKTIQTKENELANSNFTELKDDNQNLKDDNQNLKDDNQNFSIKNKIVEDRLAKILIITQTIVFVIWMGFYLTNGGLTRLNDVWWNILYFIIFWKINFFKHHSKLWILGCLQLVKLILILQLYQHISIVIAIFYSESSISGTLEAIDLVIVLLLISEKMNSKKKYLLLVFSLSIILIQMIMQYIISIIYWIPMIFGLSEEFADIILELVFVILFNFPLIYPLISEYHSKKKPKFIQNQADEDIKDINQAEHNKE